MQVIRAGRLIDGTGSPPRLDQAVYVEESRIGGVGPETEIPTDADVVDLSGSTVLPGLIDCHVHLVFSHSEYPLGDLLAEDDQQLLLRGVAAARQALRAGITTVRDLGGRGGVTFRLRGAVASGLIPGPRIMAAGSPITTTRGHCYFLGLEADGQAAVRAAARRELDSGANCLKIMATGGRMTPGTDIGRAQYTADEIRVAVDEACRARVTVAAHALGTAGRGTAVVPTLVPLARSAAALREQVVRSVRRMRELGVRVVAGTDAGVSLTPFDSLPRELEILVSEAGLSPLEAIQAATGDAARAIGIADTLGTLQAGRAADLIAVDGDPSVRIADLRAVRRVIKGGRTVVRDGAFLE